MRTLPLVTHQRHAVAAGVRDPLDVYYDDGSAYLGYLWHREIAATGHRLELGVACHHDRAATMQAKDPWRSRESAQHDDDPAVLPQVSDRLRSATDRVQVGHRVVIEHAQGF